MPGKIRVIYLITGLGTGGAEMMLLRFLKTIDRNCFQPQVVVLVKTANFLKEKFDQAGIPVTVIGMKSKLDLGILFKLYRLLKKNNPHILHTQLFAADIIGRIVGRIAGVPIVITSIRNSHYGGIVRDIMLRLTEGFADQTTFVSKNAADEFVKKRVLKEEKARIIYNGLNINDFAGRKNYRSIKEIRENLHVPPAGFLLLCVGSLTRQKGYPDLLRAFELLCAKRSDTTLVIAGSGPLKHKIEEMVTQKGLQERVRMLGRCENIPELMAAADLFVLSSYWEGMPGAVMEAMASELPVVATSAGGTPELVVNGLTGKLVPVGNPGELAAALDNMLSLPDTARLAMGSMGRKRIEKLFQVNTMMNNYINLYKECLINSGLLDENI